MTMMDGTAGGIIKSWRAPRGQWRYYDPVARGRRGQMQAHLGPDTRTHILYCAWAAASGRFWRVGFFLAKALTRAS